MSRAPHIGPVALGTLPRVVLAINKDATSLQEAVQAGVHIFEVRVDQFQRTDVLSVVKTVTAMRTHGLPLIGTVRGRHEGGSAFLTDAERADLYLQISDLVEAIDVEMRSRAVVERVRDVIHAAGSTLILSHHDFKRTPTADELDGIVAEAIELKADIIKVATFARTPRDVETLTAFTQRHRDHNLVAIALGSIGSISRLVFPLYGSLMTYTSTSPSDGQIRLETLVEHLRLYYPELNEEYIRQLGLLEYA